MVNVETTSRHQPATLWAFSTYDRHGEPKVSSPTDIVVRWVTKRSEIMGNNDTPITTTGRIVVSQDVTEGSLLREGKVADLPTTVSSGLIEVIGFDKTPDLKSRSYRRVCIVRKFKDSLPTVV